MAFTKFQTGEFLIIGVLPKDVEFKTVGDKNSSLCKFSVKASETEINGKKDVKWTNCVAWHGVARVCQNYKKGDVVLVMGKIEDNNYKDKNGVEKTGKNLIVEFTVKMSQVAENVAKQQTDVLADVDLSEYDVLSDEDAPF